ncbi:MAG: chromosomal replication initiator protein DnaA [Candidatus Gastranaerophilales bacterium]|nr:chromosomal replication initiator protein DnaA [Candidatus Gastranaerophilales bacterium]
MSNSLNKKETEAWSIFLQILEEKLPAFTAMWAKDLEPALPLFEESENEIFLIKSSQNFGIQVLQQKHLKEVEEALTEVTGLKRAVRFILDETVKKKKTTAKQTKEQKEHNETAQRMENLAQMHSFCGLNLKYTFDNFVEGENSKFAYKIAQMISEAPGQKYNPLFISGSVGLGKTHLMQAIGHKILKNFPNLKIRYTKAEDFGNKLIESLASCKNSGDVNEKMRKFRDMHRNVDVLLIDDIQWIDGKKRTEEEIFNTFDALYHAGKQIIFASDRPLSAFELIPDRLRSRFEWGIEARIEIPNLETRMKIVKRHAILSDYPISDDVALFLAKEFNTNIRELEGAYNKASARASIEGEELTVELTKEYLNFSERAKKITVDNILETCAKYFSVDKKEILSTARAKEVVNARKYAIYLSRELLDLSYPNLAKEFNKNHTTIMYQHEKLKKDIETNKAMQIVTNELSELIKK